jgi:hypothetical protein
MRVECDRGDSACREDATIVGAGEVLLDAAEISALKTTPPPTRWKSQDPA